jgi:hypothetical protein
MKLLGSNGTLVVELSELEAAGTQADEDVLLSVTVDASGFAAHDQSWVTAKEWNGFLVELRALEQRRQGRATLVAASPEDLRLEFFSTDQAGHMAVQGHVRRQMTERFELQLRFGFVFEPDELPRMLRELEAITTTKDTQGYKVG